MHSTCLRSKNIDDSETGRWTRVKDGEKPPKMIEMELKRNVVFEQEYQEKYVEAGMSQKKFAKLWDTPRGNIFGCKDSANPNRRSWIQMLGLSKRGDEPEESEEGSFRLVKLNIGPTEAACS